MTDSVFKAFKNKSTMTPEPEPFDLEEASLAHEVLESRRGGGSLFLKP